MKLQGIVIEKEDVAKIGNQFCNIPFLLLESKRDDYSVVTLLARFLGLSTSVPFAMAV